MEFTARQNLLKVFLLLLVAQLQTANGENLVRCSILDTRNCTISGLTLSLQNFTFTPVANNPSIVVGLEIKKSTVPVITTKICTALPKIKTFTAIQQGIQVIEDYAFNNCTEITLISMPFNNIHTLGKGIFDNAKRLQEINIHGGSLETIDEHLLDNSGELLELVISANKLKELPVAAVKNLKKLRVLYLYTNELVDLDAEGLVSKLPSLRAVYINDNNFHCDRLSDIIIAFQAKNILIIDHTHAIYLKKRDYIPHRIQDIICLSHVELEAEKLKKGLNLSLTELKDYPLAKAVIQLKDIVSSGFQDVDKNIVTLYNTLNGSSSDLSGQVVKLNQTLSNTTREVQKLADALAVLSNNYKTLSSHTSSSAIWIVVIVCTLLVIGVVIFFVFIKVKKVPFNVPFSYHRNDMVPLNEE